MIFSKKKRELPSTAGDQLAATVAAHIVKWQRRIAASLNVWMNQYSPKRQKWLFLICCGTFAGGLIISLWLSSGRITSSIQAQPYQTAHIGSPSARPVNAKPLKSTDSLTKKNKHHGKSTANGVNIKTHR